MLLQERCHHLNAKADPKNRLNDLNSKLWLQFQKSWFALSSPEPPVDEFISFFSKKNYPDGHTGTVCLVPASLTVHIQKSVLTQRTVLQIDALSKDQKLDYAFYDARFLADNTENIVLWQKTIEELRLLATALRELAYLTVVVRNQRNAHATDPVAWRLARHISAFLTQKDEKIGCLENQSSEQQIPWVPNDSIVYFLNFRKQNSATDDLRSTPAFATPKQAVEGEPGYAAKNFRDGWYVHRPPRRDKNVMLHPAKFPEDLVQRYITNFTEPGEWVFDPMAGTGSSLVAALACSRKAAGIELNPEFDKIAKSRFTARKYLKLVTGDAAAPESYHPLPEQMAYCITSPPYWDMLRMRGAETQAKRKKQGLQRWYSEDARDLGNIADYHAFLDLLERVYRQVAGHLLPGRYMTIIVKNVKKQGTIYPLAWDIVERLSAFLIFAGEQFWCQDDQRLAPFGYRYAWVSNTFHHYCLTFRKPEGSFSHK